MTKKTNRHCVSKSVLGALLGTLLMAAGCTTAMAGPAVAGAHSEFGEAVAACVDACLDLKFEMSANPEDAEAVAKSFEGFLDEHQLSLPEEMKTVEEGSLLNVEKEASFEELPEAPVHRTIEESASLEDFESEEDSVQMMDEAAPALMDME